MSELSERLRKYNTHTEAYHTDLMEEAADALDQKDELLACAYQLAGVVGAPLRFLDALSRCEGNADTLLPVSLDECDEFTAKDAEIAALKERVGELEAQLSTATDALQVRWRLNPSTPHFVIEGE